MRQTADRDPLSSISPSSPAANSVQTQHELLQQLALRGAWRSILEAIKGQQVADQEQLLCQAAYYTLALTKLRNYNAANAELQKIGDLNAAHLTRSENGGQLSPSPPACGCIFPDTLCQNTCLLCRYCHIIGAICAEVATGRCKCAIRAHV